MKKKNIATALALATVLAATPFAVAATSPRYRFPLHRAFPSTWVSNPRSSSSLPEAATASRGSPPTMATA